jgi:HEAT repeat protein
MNAVKPRRGKAVMLWTAGAGVAVLLALVWVLRRPILEEWYLLRLRSESEETRKLAAARLGELESVRAVPRLLEILRKEAKEADRDEEKHYAVRALLRIGIPALPRVLDALQDAESASEDSLDSLLEIVEAFGPAAFPVLLRAVNDKNETVTEFALFRVALYLQAFRVREQVTGYLSRLGVRGPPDEEGEGLSEALHAWTEPGPLAEEAVGILFHVIESDTRDMARRFGALALGYLGSPARLVLLGGLKHADVIVRLCCLAGLECLLPQDRDLIEHYIEALGDRAWEVRGAAALTLRGVGPPAQEAVPALARLLDDERQEVRRCVLMALLKIGPAASAMSRLVKLITNESDPPGDRKWAAVLLGRIGPGAGDAIPALVNSLEDEDPEVRTAVIEALGEIGAAAREAVPALIGLLDDPNVRNVVAYALGGIGPAAEDAVPALIPLLCYPVGSTQRVVRATLVRIGPAAVRGLIESLLDEDPFLRSAAAETLGSFGSGAGEAVHGLRAALGDEYTLVSWKAAQALGEIGPGAREAVPALLKMFRSLDSGDWYVRATVIEALGRIGPAASAAVVGMQEALSDRDSDVRAEAALALWRLGSDARPLTSPLVKALEDESVLVRLPPWRCSSSGSRINIPRRLCSWRSGPVILSSAREPPRSWEASGWRRRRSLRLLRRPGRTTTIRFARQLAGPWPS